MTYQETRSAAYGFFPNDSHLESVLQTLNLAGFENEDLCVLIPAERLAARLKEMDYKVGHDSNKDASPVCVIAWLSTYGAVVIPDIGFFVGSRQYLQALAIAEEFLKKSEKSVFVGLGISASDAARYESRMHDRASFVFVSCDDVPRSEWARELLSAMGAEEARLLRQDNQSQAQAESHRDLTN